MKTNANETLLQKLLNDFDGESENEWIESCKAKLEQQNRFVLADLLRDISVELRSNSTVDANQRIALEKLKSVVLNITLQIDQQANIENIRYLKSKINKVPEDIVESIQRKLENVERDARDDRADESIQDRIANSERIAEEIEKLRGEFEVESKRRILDADLADREQERSARKFQSFAQRESIANLLGGVLLLVFSAVLIVSLFVEIKEPSMMEIIKNAFLVLLGFFFGQNVKSAKNMED